jgi:hypothetical protein
VSELEARIGDVIGTIDGILEESQQEQAGEGGGGQDASGTGGGFPTPGGSPGSSAASSGAEGGSSEIGAEDSGDESGSGESDSSTIGAGEHDGSPTGPVPTYGEDTDTFRRQICEAAGKESDPELRDALERECRKYGGTPTR